MYKIFKVLVKTKVSFITDLLIVRELYYLLSIKQKHF